MRSKIGSAIARCYTLGLRLVGSFVCRLRKKSANHRMYESDGLRSFEVCRRGPPPRNP